MNNIKTIQVQAYTENGLPTCGTIAGMVCPFYRSTRFGQSHNCSIDGSELQRRDSGYLIPHDNCPVWGDHVTNG